MTKKTDDDVANTRDERTKIDSVDKDVETKLLSPDQEDEKTVKISDSGHQPRSAATETPFTSNATIGDYRIIRKIGEGGMGVVYEAEQQRPRRLVALKVIRGGLHADDFHVKMFAREIRALARLKHPGIASIYESGRSDDGQFFFAMELVQGTSLDEFIEDETVPSSEEFSDIDNRLKLFSQICDVVSYAHQRGVIHRDLKPQNILVTGETEEPASTASGSGKIGVKILDFGLARITDPDVAGGATDMSQIGQIKGTLRYMSPEQVRGRPDDIDVRSDVYSLGAILFEMLTGEMPYDLSKASIPEAIRVICEELPKMPSEVWTKSSKRSQRIDTDVETIVLKALEKEPDRRYQSVAAFVEDIERYMANQPILARPQSAFYQFRKLVARQKAAFASLAAIFLMLLGFGVVMAAQSVRIANERDKALKAEQTAEERKNDAEKSRNEMLLARNAEQKQRKIAENNLTRAEAEQKRAEDEKASAKKAQKAEEEQRRIAETNLIEAQNQEAIADKQTSIAQQQKSLADQRAIEANEQKADAENKAEEIRRLLYVSQMNLADQAWEQAEISRMNELLEMQIPSPGQVDLRGFEWYYLWRLSHRDIRTFSRPGSVRSIDYSPDGRTLITNQFEESNSTTLRQIKSKVVVLDVANGQEIDSIPDSHYVALSASGNELAIFTTLVDNFSNPGPRKLQLWDLESKKLIPLKTSANTIVISPSSFSPDGKFLAVVEAENVELLDKYTGKVLRSFERPIPGYVSSVHFSPDGQTLAAIAPSSGTAKTQIVFWDVNSGKELATLESSETRSLEFSPDGETFATGDTSGKVKIWDATGRTELAVLDQGGDAISSLYTRIAYSPDGRFLAASIGRAVKIYDIQDRRKVSTIRGHGEPVTSLSFSPDGGTLATGGLDNKVKLWSIPFGLDVARLDEQRGATLSPDGKILATDHRFEINLWDIATNQKLLTFEQSETEQSNLLIPAGVSYPVIPKGRHGFVSPKFSADGKIIALSRATVPLIDIWDLATQKRIATTIEGISDFVLPYNRNPLVTVTFDGIVRVWDIGRQKMISSFPAIAPDEARERKFSFKLSPNGKILAVKAGPTLKLMDTATGKELVSAVKIDTNFGNFEIEFSPDSKLLVKRGLQGLALVDVATGVELYSTDAAGSFPLAAFSSNGRILAIRMRRDVFLLDTASLKQIGILSGHGEFVMSLTFSPDGKRIATAGQDKTVKIWDVSTQQNLITIDELPTGLMFSPDGRTLIGSGLFGMPGVQIWRGATDVEVQKNRGH